MITPTPAGGLPHSVELYDLPVQQQDEYGQVIDTPVLIGRFRAKVSRLRGRALQAAQQVYTSVTHEVEMRWLGSAIPATSHNPNAYILPQMYLVLRDGRRLDVVDADNVDEARRMWTLVCNEKVIV